MKKVILVISSAFALGFWSEVFEVISGGKVIREKVVIR